MSRRAASPAADASRGGDASASTAGLSPLPWQAATAARLLADRERLPHGLLVTAPPGSGAAEFARALAAALLCESPEASGAACGRCAACGWFAAGNHPDYRWVGVDDGSSDGDETEAGGEGEAGASPAAATRAAPARGRGRGTRRRPEIRIDAIRALADFVSVGAHRAGRRVVVVAAADRLNLPAANALLKTLEEPSPGVVFVLATEASARLLPTVRSRCVPVTLPGPSPEAGLGWLTATTGAPDADASRWLDAAGGAPVAALAFADPARAEADRTALAAIAALPDADLLETAARLEPIEAATWVPLLQRWIEDLARVAAGAPARARGADAARLAALAARTSLAALASAASAVTAQRRAVDHPLNPRLFAEATLDTYVRAFRRRRPA